MIDRLKAEITALEEQAGTMDPNDKEALYEILVQAFFKAKDLIIALEETTPEPVVQIDTDEVDRLTSENDVLKTNLGTKTKSHDELLESNKVLSEKLQSISEILA